MEFPKYLPLTNVSNDSICLQGPGPNHSVFRTKSVSSTIEYNHDSNENGTHKNLYNDIPEIRLKRQLKKICLWMDS